MVFWFAEGHGNLPCVCVTIAFVQEKVAHRKLERKSERMWDHTSACTIIVLKLLVETAIDCHCQLDHLTLIDCHAQKKGCGSDEQ